MTRIRLEYVHEFRDRHGKIRRYFRGRDGKRAPLPGLPGSDEFITAYRVALAGLEIRSNSIGQQRTRPGTVNSALVAYYQSEAFAVLRPGTQKMRRAILERFRSEAGDWQLAGMNAKYLAARMMKLKPFAARNWLKTLRGFLQFAVELGFCAADPTREIKLRKAPKTDGIHTWTEEEIEQFEAAHAIGTRPRLAFALLLFTAQRKGDVIRIGPQHVRNGAISVRQEKTGTRVEIPLHSDLARVLDGTASDHLTFLTTGKGQPYSAAGFGNDFRDWCRAAKLPEHCSSHGLRKAACRRLAEVGCSAHQIMAISGHKSLSEVQRYTRAADQKRLAVEAMRVLETKMRTSIGKP